MFLSLFAHQGFCNIINVFIVNFVYQLLQFHSLLFSLPFDGSIPIQSLSAKGMWAVLIFILEHHNLQKMAIPYITANNGIWVM